jgi:hypothetical protein
MHQVVPYTNLRRASATPRRQSQTCSHCRLPPPSTQQAEKRDCGLPKAAIDPHQTEHQMVPIRSQPVVGAAHLGISSCCSSILGSGGCQKCHTKGVTNTSTTCLTPAPQARPPVLPAVKILDRMLWSIVAFPCTAVHTIMWLPSSAMVTAAQPHRRPSTLRVCLLAPMLLLLERDGGLLWLPFLGPLQPSWVQVPP